MKYINTYENIDFDDFDTYETDSNSGIETLDSSEYLREYLDGEWEHYYSYLNYMFKCFTGKIQYIDGIGINSYILVLSFAFVDHKILDKLLGNGVFTEEIGEGGAKVYFVKVNNIPVLMFSDDKGLSIETQDGMSCDDFINLLETLIRKFMDVSDTYRKYVESMSDYLPHNENNVGMGSLFYTEYPYQYNTMDNPSDRGEAGNVDYHRKVNKFELIQDELKNLIRKEVSRRGQNPSDEDVESMLRKFFELGDVKNAEIKTISDNCKNVKKCAKQIFDRYVRYVRANFYPNTESDVEQGSVSENVDFDNFDFYEYPLTLHGVYDRLIKSGIDVKYSRIPFGTSRIIELWYNDRMFNIYNRHGVLVIFKIHDPNVEKPKSTHVDRRRIENGHEIKSIDDMFRFLKDDTSAPVDVVGYFVCYQRRRDLSNRVCEDLYRYENITLYKTLKAAYDEMLGGFYDDYYYYGVVALLKGGGVRIIW